MRAGFAWKTIDEPPKFLFLYGGSMNELFVLFAVLVREGALHAVYLFSDQSLR